ncbi:DUF2623 family protein [Yersinia vastinensis]|uniref:DUF2623 family protein n=1 Tax=Yersinia vastinensis TaxID=2890318 RepID=UPI0005E21CC2|nr:DUF2623 family protein [Yersinia vastinensis]OVZ96224.1 hypothetical protein CBW53_16440 [Yersinia frederiksenii]CNI04400.1 Protein of uncharacterised function (DUF2623) [Yersinia frederiksenii]
MGNHFGKGLMAGLKAEYTKPATEIAKFCSDYKRGFVLGYAYHLAESTGDENQAAYQAGLLCREYGLDKALTSEFFSGGESRLTVKFFSAGYDQNLHD